MKIEIEENHITVDGVKYMPEVKKELESGKWYKWYDHTEEANILICITNIDENSISRYGFVNDRWNSDFRIYTGEKYKEAIDNLTEATEQEVFEALKNEAVKRGYKEGTHIKRIRDNSKKINVIDSDFDWEIYYPEAKWALRDSSGHVIFQDGIWAPIVETITKKEAEVLLNKKIV